jgi:nitroreductase
MNDFLELCLRRQSCRAFLEKSVEHEKLVNCAEAGRLSPSACNSQPWSFVVIESPDKVKEIAASGQQMNMNPFLSKAGAFIIVFEEYAQLMPSISGLLDSRYFVKSDIGGAVVNICLEAEAQGLGTCIIGIFNRTAIAKILNVPKEKSVAAFIAVGYPESGKVRNKIRKPIDEVARFV